MNEKRRVSAAPQRAQGTNTDRIFGVKEVRNVRLE